MPLSKYDKIAQAIATYKSDTDGARAELRPPLILDLVVIVIIPLSLTIVSAIFSNIAGILTTLGVGGIHAEERFRRGQTVLKSYWGECSRLKKSVKRLEFELLLCRRSDTASLQKIETRLRAYYDELP